MVIPATIQSLHLCYVYYNVEEFSLLFKLFLIFLVPLNGYLINLSNHKSKRFSNRWIIFHGSQHLLHYIVFLGTMHLYPVF